MTETVGAEKNHQRRHYSLFNIWVVSVVLKLLLSVGYHSTDFEVHRNWLAITSSLPVSQWYIDTTSQWTLDYPPFFAYFEWFVSRFVSGWVLDDGCLKLVEEGLYGLPTILFQRLSVIVSELVLLASLQWYINTSKTKEEERRAFVIASSLVLSPGILIIDHIHFQYNGMLYGILVLVINCARLERYLLCGFWFATLLCFKHIYLYLAPAIFVFLLRKYCLNFEINRSKPFFVSMFKIILWKNLFKLSLVVLSVFTVAFGPFLYYNVLPQLLERMFPFSRGLTHAYWAPNFWAIYSALDRLLILIYTKIPFSQRPLIKLFKFDLQLLSDQKLLNKTTRGIIGESEFLVLPRITPQITFFLTSFYQIMALIPLFLQPTFRCFLGSLTLCGYASFLLGWHVHEKAVLLIIFPISFLAGRDKDILTSFGLLVSCGYVSLFPLIFTCEEWLIKVTYTLLWYIIYYSNFRKVVRAPKRYDGHGKIILDRVGNCYILAILPLVFLLGLAEMFEGQFTFLRRFSFLKLMLMSTYCAFGIMSSWIGFSWLYFVDETIKFDD